MILSETYVSLGLVAYLVVNLKNVNSLIACLLVGGLYRQIDFFSFDFFPLFAISSVLISGHFLYSLIVDKKIVKGFGWILSFGLFIALHTLIFGQNLDEYSSYNFSFAVSIVPIIAFIHNLSGNGRVQAVNVYSQLVIIMTPFLSLLLRNLFFGDNIVTVGINLSVFELGYMAVSAYLVLYILSIILTPGINVNLKRTLIGLSLLCLVLNPSKGVIISFLLVTVLYFLRFKSKTTILGVVLLGSVLLAFSDVLLDLISVKSDSFNNSRLFDLGTNSSSIESRTPLFAKGIEYFVSNPFFGKGSGSVSRFFSEKGLHSHNLLVHVLSNFGLIGMFFFIRMISIQFIGGKKKVGLFIIPVLFYLFWSMVSGDLYGVRNLFFLLFII